VIPGQEYQPPPPPQHSPSPPHTGTEGSQASVPRAPAGMLSAQIIEYYNPSAPPPPHHRPKLLSVSSLQIPMQPSFPVAAGSSYPPQPPSTGLVVTAPPSQGPLPPPPDPPGSSFLSSSPVNGPPVAETKRQTPIGDALSDLEAIQIGIQLEKKYKSHVSKRAERERGGGGDDMAAILSRHVAMEYSDYGDSDSDEDGLGR
uniref:Uncharacterized protein n=1 Tax=Myotis lucifugus TaxID=59463 RepID=G1Q3F9_MYOLU